MNKELIKTYFEEFKHWLNGGNIQVYYKLDNILRWWTDKEFMESCNNGNDNFSHMIKYSLDPNDVLVVIDDEYVEFRKALAEGKTIQYLPDDSSDWKDCTNQTSPSRQFLVHPTKYRIKSDEPKFKVGDWVILPNKTKEVIINSDKNSVSTTNWSVIGIYSNTYASLELWEPKGGEYCWFWNEPSDVPILAKLISIEYFLERPTEYKIKTPSYISETVYSCMTYMYFKNCEPFIGQLPTILKD